MSRAEHTFRHGDVVVTLTVPDGVEVPPWIRLKDAGELAQFDHSGVRNVRAPIKRKPRIEGATLISADWTPPLAELERMRVACPSVNFEHELAQMIDWYTGKGQRMKDHTAVWRRWIRATHKSNVEKGWKASSTSRPVESGQQKWLREHALTLEEYEARKGDAAWLEKVKRRGVVA